jgi:nucleoside 2-deoxyribosyltransferase
MKAFLAMPVSDNLASNGAFRPERRAFFERFVHVLTERDIQVASAGTNEDWGAIKLSPRQFTHYDIESIGAADLLVVVTNERLNRDMYLEVGLAVARQLPVIFVIPASTKLTYMALGMEELGAIRVYRYESDAEAVDALRRGLDDLSSSGAGAGPPRSLESHG